MSAEKNYPVHPAANMFPMMTEEEYQGLKADIKNHGLKNPITTWGDYILDGRNRLRACEEVGEDPFYEELGSDQDPYEFVISNNLHRRHLTTSQRSTVAAKLADLKHGGNRKSENIKVQNCTLIDDAAKALNVSPRSVKTARQVLKSGDADLINAVECGKMTVSKAASLVLKKPAKQAKPEVVKEGELSVYDKFLALKPELKKLPLIDQVKIFYHLASRTIENDIFNIYFRLKQEQEAKAKSP